MLILRDIIIGTLNFIYSWLKIWQNIIISQIKNKCSKGLIVTGSTCALLTNNLSTKGLTVIVFQGHMFGFYTYQGLNVTDLLTYMGRLKGSHEVFGHLFLFSSLLPELFSYFLICPGICWVRFRFYFINK